MRAAAAWITSRDIISANVNVVRRALVALNERDAETFIGLVTEDVVWVTPAVSVETKAYHGRNGVRQFFADADAAWKRIDRRADEIRDLGDRVLVLGKISWHGPVEVAGPFGSVVDLEGDKINRIHTYRTASEALAAIGLAE